MVKIGYISRRIDADGKEKFSYREGSATRRIGVRSDTIKVRFLYGTTPYDEVRSNTEMLKNENIMLVREPFFTDEKMRERCEKWCDWANSCEHREYSFFAEVGGDE